MSSFRLLITKNISPASKAYAEKNSIVVEEKAFIHIEPITAEPTREAIWQFLQIPMNAVFTSINAVRCVQSVIEKELAASDGYGHKGDNAEPIKKTNRPDWKIFCVEGATSDAAAAIFGKENIIATASSASELAQAIACSMQRTSPPAKSVFFCGNRRRDEIPQYLKSKNIELTELIVYETKACPVSVDESYDGIAFFSPSTVESFFSLNGPQASPVYFSIGATTAGAIQKHTDQQVVISEFASEESLIQSVINYIEQKASRTKEKD